MLRTKRVWRFFLTAVLVYALLMTPFPRLTRSYARLFRSCGNVLFVQFWFWPDGAVRFLNLKSLSPADLPPGTPTLEAAGTFDTAMELRSRRAPGALGYLLTSSRYIAYAPTVVVVALVLATPTSWTRRGWALLWGLLLIHAFIALRLTLTLAAKGFAAAKDYALFHPGPFWRDVLTRVESIVSDDPTVSFVVPVFVWLLVTLYDGSWITSDRGGGSHPI